MSTVKKILENRNNRIMLVILIIGIAIIVISSAVPGTGTGTAQTVTQNYGEEERLSEILSEIDGAGRVSVMMSYVSPSERDAYPQVKGVIVIADGADKPQVKQKIKEAVIAVTGVGANRACVFTRKK